PDSRAVHFLETDDLVPNLRFRYSLAEVQTPARRTGNVFTHATSQGHRHASPSRLCGAWSSIQRGTSIRLSVRLKRPLTRQESHAAAAYKKLPFLKFTH